MGFAALAFLVIFLLIVSGGLLLFYREAMFQRLSDIVTPRGKQGALLSAILQSGSSIGGMVGNLERILPKSAAEVSVTQKRLIRAGHREESAVNVFYGVKVLVPLTFCFLVMVSGLGHNNAFFAYAIALGLGFLAPDFWLGRRITARRRLAPPTSCVWLILQSAMNWASWSSSNAQDALVPMPGCNLRNVQPWTVYVI
jgi:tight adherence protein C